MNQAGKLHSLTSSVDLYVIFPPQWSPYQPFLSTPSLKAYLEPKGFRVCQSDWNVRFYRYFIGGQRLGLARRRLEHYANTLSDNYSIYRARSIFALATLENFHVLQAKVDKLKVRNIAQSIPDFRESVEAFYSLLDAFSVAEPVVDVGASSLSHPGVLTSFDSLHRFVENRYENPFLDFSEEEVSKLSAPRYFGLSIIGGEQIVPGLTLCRVLRKRFPDVPIVIGGSVFSRLVEKETWLRELFGVYFDYICRYEGEQPMAAFLSSGDPEQDQTPNIAFLRDDKIVMTPLCEPLNMDAVPTPNFSDLQLTEYLSPEVVLPLLTTRGCYWGKCAFCYHGMIYQDRYRMRNPDLIAKDVLDLNERHGVRHFAFNDEALPPKLFRLLPEVIPPKRFFFTALYKFEKFYAPEDYRRMYDIGFRSMYIGLETASERVQRHMRKNNLQNTMISNLKGGHDAGIWNHAFVFFGFPTETEAEAEETIEFMVKHADIIHSEGTGTFSFEHNAPIHHAPHEFGVRSVGEKSNKILELYYDYEVISGLNVEGAACALQRFNQLKREKCIYQTGKWIPREYLLLLLSYHGREKLREGLVNCEVAPAIDPSISRALTGMSLSTSSVARHYIVNRLTKQVFETNEDALTLLNMIAPEIPLSEVVRTFPSLRCVI